MQKFVTEDQTLVSYVYLNCLWPLLETGDIATWILDLAQCAHFQIHITVNEITRDVIGKYYSSSILQILFLEGSEFMFGNRVKHIDIYWMCSLS